MAKRRKTTSAPPSRGRKTAATDDEIPLPASIVAAWGWTDGNKALFEEWKTYYGKLVLTSNVITEEDADTLLQQHKKQIDEQQALQEEQTRVMDHQAVHPVAKATTAPKECHRHDPMAKTPTEQDKP